MGIKVSKVANPRANHFNNGRNYFNACKATLFVISGQGVYSEAGNDCSGDKNVM